MTVVWFSGGVSSFIATYLFNDKLDRIIYTHIDDQHPDTIRFIKDCEKVLNKRIDIIQSPYKNVENVVRASGWINGVGGAKCTDWLKRRMRKQFENRHKSEQLTYVWGYDNTELKRIERIKDSNQKQNHIFPLLDNNFSKENCHAILQELGIKRPKMYEMGYRNNNCLGCVKGGMGYWNKIRKDFPKVFESRAKLERDIGASCIKGIYLDELDPNRGRLDDEIMPECGIACMEFANEKKK